MPDSRDGTVTLTDRQVQVLRHLASGLDWETTGRRLFITADTVRAHVERAMERLGARTATHAVVLAHRHGLLPLGDDELVTLTAAEVNARRRQRSRDRHVAAPPDVAERFPSVLWGEAEWLAALLADDDLYLRILRGIGKVSARHPSRRPAA